MDPTIFKAYDTRGIYPDQTKDGDGWQIGCGAGCWLAVSSWSALPRFAGIYKLGAALRLTIVLDKSTQPLYGFGFKRNLLPYNIRGD